MPVTVQRLRQTVCDRFEGPKGKRFQAQTEPAKAERRQRMHISTRLGDKKRCQRSILAVKEVGAGASAPKTVLATGHISHNKSPKTKHLPFSSTASLLGKRRPNPPPNGRGKVLHNGSTSAEKNVLDHKSYDPMKSHLQTTSSYLNRKLSPTSKFKYGVDRSIELPLLG